MAVSVEAANQQEYEAAPDGYSVKSIDYDWTVNQQPKRLAEADFDAHSQIN